jgi:hypothetical protein
MKKKANQESLIETLHFIFELYEEWKIEKAKQKAKEEAEKAKQKADKIKQKADKIKQAREEQAREEQARQEQARQEQARQEQARQEQAKQVKINLTSSRKILGVKATATEEEIRTAWKNALKIWHPDLYSSKTKEEQDKANEMSRLVNMAYQFLKQRQNKAS